MTAPSAHPGDPDPGADRAALSRLEAVLAGLEAPTVAVAVSGGIDSLTLAAAAIPLLGARLVLHHAVSPAVPPEATRRVRALADGRGASLSVFDAGEFDDPRYRANPADRCFFCKTSLYGAIVARLQGQEALVLSGTNLDDLSDWRPGLQAAATHGVRHPFVEAGIGKACLRRIAPLVGLAALADLPSAPCLSSRIETGLAIDPALLSLVHAAERLVSGRLSAWGIAAASVRCRVRRDGLVVELDAAALSALERLRADALAEAVRDLAGASGFPGRPVRLAAYRTGSAFLRPGAADPRPPVVAAVGGKQADAAQAGVTPANAAQADAGRGTSPSGAFAATVGTAQAGATRAGVAVRS